MAAVKVALQILLHGDWIYDALSAGDGADDAASADARWMYVDFSDYVLAHVLCFGVRV